MAYMSPQEMAALPPQLRALYERINAGKTTNNRTSSDAELMGAVGAGLPTQAVTAARQRVVQAQQGAQNQPVIQQGNAGLGGAYGYADPRVANAQYDYTNPFYQGDVMSWINGLNDQMRYAPQQSLEGAGTGGVELPFTMQKYGDQTIRYMPDGTYQVIDNRQAFESDRTAADRYDAQGNFLGGNYVDNRQSGLGKGIDSLVKAATVAMIGGGIAGGFGVGPMASGGAPATGGAAGAGGAGAGGIGAAAGDAGLMYAGADAGAAGFLGSAPATLGGSVAGAGSVAGGLSGAAAGDAGLMYAGQNAASTMGLGSAPATLGGSVGGTAAMGAGAAGAGGAGGAAGGSSSLGGLLKSGASSLMGGGGGGSSLLGSASSLLGAVSGAQGQGGGTTTQTSQMDPRMASYVYDQLLPRVQQNIERQMPGALKDSAAMRQVGLGLLGTDTTPDSAENPYLSGVADDMQRRTMDLLGQNNLAIQGNAVSAGGLGGSRQGVAQGMAAGQAADSLQGQLANLYYGSYNSDANRALQKVGLGAGLISGGQEMAWNPLQSAANIYQPFTGLNSSMSTTAPKEGGGWQGAVGGLLAGASMGRQAGWW